MDDALWEELRQCIRDWQDAHEGIRDRDMREALHQIAEDFL